MNISIITAFPQLFPGSLGVSVFKNAMQKGLFNLNIIDIKRFTTSRIDKPPYGGGPGMIIRADVLSKAIDHALSLHISDEEIPIVFTTPNGITFSQSTASSYSTYKDMIFVCGRYEGIDYRIIEYYNLIEVSMGNYIVSGGEVAVFAILESVLRLLPGVLGNFSSIEEESFSQNDGYLEYPQYTRPACWRGRKVPDVLLSGHHAKIACWRFLKSKIK
ncbi:MAG: tRNA (guanine-N1)-methyltransferase [Candidatus Xenolissoclinum pacificiensis L6]|uniref:tRNA (guanine-N(1)-)-methyltransferase n=1 Tax=Candidatus Xenolissoclinum pacificiensis L6 TaxID=1401685 RepID=W2UZG3_9RICK|nr:MAG: tRNA (guanine-N1)-methyltransferase [Candidatus Xenolissoclinum pacificiensis L6]